MLPQAYQLLHRPTSQGQLAKPHRTEGREADFTVHSLETDRLLHHRDIDRVCELHTPQLILWGIADNDQEGESIRGQLSCAPNARNNRDLDIVVDYEVTGDQATSGQMVYKM